MSPSWSQTHGSSCPGTSGVRHEPSLCAWQHVASRKLYPLFFAHVQFEKTLCADLGIVATLQLCKGTVRLCQSHTLLTTVCRALNFHSPVFKNSTFTGLPTLLRHKRRSFVAPISATLPLAGGTQRGPWRHATFASIEAGGHYFLQASYATADQHRCRIASGTLHFF